MKKLLTIAFILISIISYAQTQGTSEINNIKINGEIRTSTTTPNVIPDYVITQDTANNITTYSNVLDSDVIPVISLIDTIPLYLLDSVQTNKIVSNSELSLNIGTIEAMRLTEDTVFVDSTFAPLQIKFPDGTIQTTAATGVSNIIIDETSNNVALGYQSGASFTSGVSNTLTGNYSGNLLTTGGANSLYGYLAGGALTTQQQNTMIGYNAGRNSTGNYNVFLGYQAGYSETGSNKLYIDNSNTSSPLIYGDFSTNTVTVNDTLEVTGTIKGVVNVAKAQVLYTNTSQTTIVTLPANAVVWNVYTEVVTLFNDSGTDYLDVGITTSINKYISSYDMNTAEWLDWPPSSDLRLTASTNVSFQYTGQNSDATQGEAYVYIYYTIF